MKKRPLTDEDKRYLDMAELRSRIKAYKISIRKGNFTVSYNQNLLLSGINEYTFTTNLAILHKENSL